MSKEKIILIGGGGHCKACIDVIEQQATYEIAGIVDLPSVKGNLILGYEIIADDSQLEELSKNYRNFLITLGQLTSADVRIRLYRLLKSLNVNLPVIISPSALVSSHATIGEGSIIMHRAIVNSQATVGNNCIINTGSLVEHDTSIGDHSHIATNSTINGQVSIGNECFIGSNATIVQDIKISSRTNIGAGSVVTSDIADSGTYVGVPAKKIKA